MARYKVVTEGLEHGCCYDAMLIDTEDTSFWKDGLNVAEFRTVELAQKVCDYLNNEEK
jgi:hypothetical protein